MDARISNALSAYSNAAGLKTGKPAVQPAGGQQDGFGQLVNNLVTDTVSSLQKSEALTTKALLTNNVNIDELAVTISDAETSLRTIVAVRDKVIAAYQDIMKMPI